MTTLRVAGSLRLPDKAARLPVPATALEEWLAAIDDIAELKLTLRATALLARGKYQRACPPSLSVDELLDDWVVQRVEPDGGDATIRGALAAALARGTLFAARPQSEIRIFLNDDYGRRYLDKMALPTLSPADAAGQRAAGAIKPAIPAAPVPTRVNIFALYEQHIGTFGVGTAEQLRAAAEEYPASWIEAAFEIAAARNARSWSFINAILRRWHTEGRRREGHYEYGKPERDTAPDRRKTNLDDYRERYGRLPWEPDGD